jgi:hypothetical protein
MCSELGEPKLIGHAQSGKFRVVASRYSISHKTVSRSQSNSRAGWFRTTWPRPRVTAAISSCAICRLLLRPTLADVGLRPLPGKISAWGSSCPAAGSPKILSL